MPATPASSTSRCASSYAVASRPSSCPLRSFTVTGRPEPSRAAARDRDRGVVVLEHRRARAGLHDLRDRAAHVEVDEVGAAPRRRRAAALRMTSGSWPKSWIDDRPARALVGVDAQHLGARLLVAVVDPEARDHLRHREPGAVALGLQAHEPVADARQRREHDAVGDRRSRRGPSCRSARAARAERLGRRVALVEQAQAGEREEVVDLVDRPR